MWVSESCEHAGAARFVPPHLSPVLNAAGGYFAMVRLGTFSWVALPRLSESVWMLRAISMLLCTKPHFSAALRVLFHSADHFAGLYEGKCWASLACTPKQGWRECYQVTCEKEETNNCFIATNGFHMPSACVNTNAVSPKHPGAVPPWGRPQLWPPERGEERHAVLPARRHVYRRKKWTAY